MSTRRLALSFTFAFTLMAANSQAQDGILGRVGRGLDNAGRSIRGTVETEIARGQINAQERDVLRRVIKRIEWDKPLVGSVMQIEARPGGAIILRGSVVNEQIKRHAVVLVGDTIGVTSVVDELAVMKDVKVIETQPARIIDLTPPEVAPTTTTVPAPGTIPVPVPPPGGTVIIKRP